MSAPCGRVARTTGNAYAEIFLSGHLATFRPMTDHTETTTTDAHALDQAKAVLAGLAKVLPYLQSPVWSENARNDAQQISQLVKRLGSISPYYEDAANEWRNNLACYLAEGEFDYSAFARAARNREI